MKTPFNFDMLIEKLNELQIGQYYNNGFDLNIVKTKETGTTCAQIKHTSKEINISYNEIEEVVTIKTNDNSYLLFQKNKVTGQIYTFMHVDKDNKQYSVYENGISINDGPYCSVNKENKLLYPVNDNHYLEYNIDSNDIYVYYRKYNSSQGKNPDNDFVKFKYHDSLRTEIAMYNLEIEICVNTIKQQFEEHPVFSELVKTLTIPKLDYKYLTSEVDFLLEMVDIYINNKPSIKKYEAELNDVYNFVVGLTNKIKKEDKRLKLSKKKTK